MADVISRRDCLCGRGNLNSSLRLQDRTGFPFQQKKILHSRVPVVVEQRGRKSALHGGNGAQSQPHLLPRRLTLVW